MKRASAPGYDLFKTIVAVILVVILILIVLRGCGTNPGSPAPTGTIAAPNATETVPASVPATEAIPVTAATQTDAPSPVPPTAGPTTTLTPAAPTATAAVTEPPTTVPETATPTQAQSASCNTSAPSRLNVGLTARVVRRLNMRDQASINATLLQTNLTETRVEIIAGPVCEPVGNGAYLWWQIRLANGAEGWSAELPLNATSYFLEPIP
jgi:hypothetical protein